MKLTLLLLSFACLCLLNAKCENSENSTRHPGGAEQYHTPPGCIPLKDLPRFLRSGNETYPGVEPPEWCDEELKPAYLQEKPEEESVPPFNISLYHFERSNAINVTVKSQKDFISDAFIIMRMVEDDETGELGRPVGRFIPDKDTSIVCCDLVERNGIEVIPQEDDTKIVVTWLPYGDYEGPVVATVTVVDKAGRYWAKMRSEVTIADD